MSTFDSDSYKLIAIAGVLFISVGFFLLGPDEFISSEIRNLRNFDFNFIDNFPSFEEFVCPIFLLNDAFALLNQTIRNPFCFNNGFMSNIVAEEWVCTHFIMSVIALILFSTLFSFMDEIVRNFKDRNDDNYDDEGDNDEPVNNVSNGIFRDSSVNRSRVGNTKTLVFSDSTQYASDRSFNLNESSGLQSFETTALAVYNKNSVVAVSHRNNATSVSNTSGITFPVNEVVNQPVQQISNETDLKTQAQWIAFYGWEHLQHKK